MSSTTPTRQSTAPKRAASTDKYRISGHYNINDVKYDLLKIIQPFDGYMFNHKDVSAIRSLFIAYLNDLRGSYKVFGFDVASTEKQNAFTFDIQVQMQRERSSKKLKIHVGKLAYKSNGTEDVS